MKTILVTHQVLSTATFCLVVKDEADLAAQLAEREQSLRNEAKWVPKIQRDKAGKPDFAEMSPEWNGFSSQKWNPNS